MNTSFVGLLKGLLIALLLGMGLGAHAQSLEVIVATELRATPTTDGKILVQVAKGNKVDQIETRTGWIKVKFARYEGWVRQTHVKSLEAAAPASSSTAGSGASSGGSLVSMFGGGGNRPTSTTGAKTITPEDLEKAQPNPVEMAQLEKYAINMGQADAFARSGKVVAQKIDAYTGAEK